MIHCETFLAPQFPHLPTNAGPSNSYSLRPGHVAPALYQRHVWHMCYPLKGDCLIMIRISRFGCDWEGQQEINMLFHSAHVKSVPRKARPQGLSLTRLSQGPHAVWHILCTGEVGRPFTENSNGVLLESGNIQALVNVSQTRSLVSKIEYSTYSTGC